MSCSLWRWILLIYTAHSFASRYASGEGLQGLEREQLLDGIVEFAAQKLIRFDLDSWPTQLNLDQELACLSARLPIEFMSSTLTPSTRAEKDQVAHHMRICLSVDEAFCKLTTLIPSEPIVSEGACLLMNDDRVAFNAPAALSHVISGFSVHQGDRGELVALLAFTIARDKVVRHNQIRDGVFGVVPFLRALITVPSEPTTPHSKPADIFVDIMKIKPLVCKSPDDMDRPLEAAFADANLHFNHFVKQQEQNGLDEKTIQGFIARCAAVMGANGQAGFDALLPTILGTAIVNRDTQGFIFMQAKNDENHTATFQPSLFDRMDPVAMGFLKPGEILKTPIIRIVFVLASRTPSISYVSTQKRGNFTSYDIWIAGLNPDVLAVISKEDQAIWDVLLSASRGWKKIYQHDDPITVSLMKNMSPMVSQDPDFWLFRPQTARAD